MSVFPCWALISPSLVRWRLSRPALLMLLSLYPSPTRALPTPARARPRRAEQVSLVNQLHVVPQLFGRGVLAAGSETLFGREKRENKDEDPIAALQLCELHPCDRERQRVQCRYLSCERRGEAEWTWSLRRTLPHDALEQNALTKFHSMHAPLGDQQGLT